MIDRSFAIKNYHHDQLIICVEPYGHEVPLEPDAEVVVRDIYAAHPAMLTVTKSETGETILSIWPGDGDVRVEKDGVDLLAILPQTAAAIP